MTVKVSWLGSQLDNIDPARFRQCLASGASWTTVSVKQAGWTRGASILRKFKTASDIKRWAPLHLPGFELGRSAPSNLHLQRIICSLRSVCRAWMYAHLALRNDQRYSSKTPSTIRRMSIGQTDPEITATWNKFFLVANSSNLTRHHRIVLVCTMIRRPATIECH